MNKFSKSSRMVDGGYAADKPYPKKAAPVKKSAPAKAPVAKKAFKKADTAKVSKAIDSAKKFSPTAKPIGKFGRDAFTPAPRAAKTVSNRPGINRQEVEGKVMSNMYRNRLGPGQR